jgi:membrane protease YdiL (CAAX protease family)
MTVLGYVEGGSPFKFFLGVFMVTVPFWLMGQYADLELLPGLPVSSLAVFCPVTVAAVLVYTAGGGGALVELLKRSFDVGRIGSKIWYLPAGLLVPGIAFLSYAVMRLFRMPLPAPEFPGGAALFMLLTFFVAGVCEELGWSGYATDLLQRRWSALGSALFLGLVTAAWHVVPMLQVGRSPGWIASQALTMVALRVLTVWLYNNTNQSVFIAAIFHATVNLSWQLFPNQGSHYDPLVTGLIATVLAATVTVVWGPQTLTRP